MVEFEERWQREWEENKVFYTDTNKYENNFYCLVMFPYPSGKLHMGHVRNYVIGDVIARYKRMKGYNVLHPIGWDSFGLPAENAAIKMGVSPEKWTYENIENMRKQLKKLGISYDYSKEFATSDPEYYKWNQWLFIKLYEDGLAYRKKAYVNWCNSCKTVLANEQTQGGVCWRCDSPVGKIELEQWFFKITEFAEELLEGLNLLKDKWPESVITMQRNWIGKSTGAEILFKVDGVDIELKVFTTRPDTLFGATFVALAPEYPDLFKITAPEKIVDVKKFIDTLGIKREGKRGVFTGRFAINPVNNRKIPIYVAEYVIYEYGTGAIMCVPAHDTRDYEFAIEHKLPIIKVIEGPGEVYTGEGKVINSAEYSGMESEKMREKIVEDLERKKIGKKTINYKIRDWLISRQRYWGTPIPIIYCSKCGVVCEDEKNLPVLLPRVHGFKKLSEIPEFINTKCRCGSDAKREVDTMDTFVDSSWYYLRYIDNKNTTKPFDSQVVNRWLPVNIYIGGIEHACMHLIYARFIHRYLYKKGLVKTPEPFDVLLTQGMVLLGGSAMSKSRGNIVEPDEVINKAGADALRTFILFAAPPVAALEWNESGLNGMVRFLRRIKTFIESENGSYEAKKEISKTIKSVEMDIERFSFNTAIAKLMEFLNEVKDRSIALSTKIDFIKLLSPFAPHLAEELYFKLTGKKFICNEKWPAFEEKYVKDELRIIPVEINGKLKDKIEIHPGAEKEEVLKAAIKKDKISKMLNGRKIKNIYFVKDKILNIILE